jgi:uncharacterized OB-fold protein
MTSDLGQWYVQRPRPLADNVSRYYWEGLEDGELRYQACRACGTVQFYPRAICTGCGAEPVWQVADGRGAVYTFTVIRQNRSAPFRDQVPYVVAVVDVDPGFRMMGNIFDVDPDEVRFGMPVRVAFVAVDDGYAVPIWRPADL